MAKVNYDRKTEDEKERLWGPVGLEDSWRGKTLNIAVRDKLELPALMEAQRNRLRLKQYTPLGKLKRVMLAEAGESAVSDPSNPLVGNKKQYLHLDWIGIGPLIGIGSDGEDVLIAESLPEPPMLTDPAWKPRPVIDRDMVVGLRKQGYVWTTIAQQMGVTVEEVQKAASLPERDSLWPDPPKVKQSVWHRSYGPVKIGAETWECFQPVTQIEIASQAHNGFVYVNSIAPDNMGRHTALLWHPGTKRAHFVYGILEVKLPPTA